MLHTLLIPILFFTHWNHLDTESVTPEVDGPVLIELFTSQGCSSCPPADRVVADFVKDPKINVIALSFHVDYWNRLGWKDPYSDAAFSQRQYQYAEKLTNSRRVYTPQVVVNGQSGHVGSRRQEVLASIQKVAKAKTNLNFSLDLKEVKEETAHLGIESSSIPKDYDLIICLVDAQLKNEVPRGENRGRNLAHVQVVRTLKKVSSGEAQNIALDLSILDDPKAGKVVAFLQHQRSWKVAGVQEINLY